MVSIEKGGTVPLSTPTHLQLLIDMLSDAFLCASPEGKVFGCNDAACRMFGYTRAELTSLTRDDLSVPGDAALGRVVADREEKGSACARLNMRRKGGEAFEVEVASVTVPGDPPEVWVALHDLAEQRRAEEATAAMRASNEMLIGLTNAAFEAILVHRDGAIVLANRAAEVLGGVSPGGLVGKKVFDFIAPVSHDLVRSKIATLDEQPYECFGRRTDGSIFPVEVGARLAPVQIGGAPARVVALRDLTARKQLEEEFRQAQKMEAIGRLAGGVAHDFNNMLVVILSGVDLVAESLGPSHAASAELDEIKRAAIRAKELTRDLLALSRKQVLDVRVVEVGAIIEGMRSMIGRLIGEDIELAVETSRTGIRAKLDPKQLENMLMNLVVNARDAMPEGGTLTLRTKIVPAQVAKPALARAGEPRPFVQITVADTGIGMDERTKSHMFEPFFTTKGPGRGTGLGLSTVFGIVNQSGGSIAVESAVGRGTTFTIYFPCTDEAAATSATKVAEIKPHPRRATVLVAEDEPLVRRVVVTALRAAGYNVLEAVRPDDALELAKSHEGAIDLLLTDVVMPGMSGRQLSEKIVGLRPELRVLFVSGYTEDAIVHRGVLDAGVHFLPKPFSGPDLLEAVARVIA
jgi:PAS domain S-box-containing protein